MTLEKRGDALALLACAAVAAGFVFGVLWGRGEQGGVLSHDLYAGHLPNIIYALSSLNQGHGLLWNRLQNCGQPFLPATVVALFYPLNILFLVLDTHFAFIAIAVIHLFIGGMGTYALCRHYALRRRAAVTAALSFELSGYAVSLALWVPTTNLGVYVWLPVALLCCERLLELPSGWRVVALAGVLTLQLLLGQPQYLLFTYEFIALRIAWGFVTGRLSQPLQKLAALGAALALPALLGAVQLLPMAVFARASVRAHALTPHEIAPSGMLTWHGLRHLIATRSIGNVGTQTFLTSVAGAALTVFALLQSTRQRIVWFYLVAGILFAGIVLYGPLRDLYLWLPVGSAFRFPDRLLWLTAFCVIMLPAFGVEALANGVPQRGAGSVAAILSPALGPGLVWMLSPVGLQPWEWAFQRGDRAGGARQPEKLGAPFGRERRRPGCGRQPCAPECTPFFRLRARQPRPLPERCCLRCRAGAGDPAGTDV
jgi:hypothetical protein